MTSTDAVPQTTILGYREKDLEACRSLWVELTEWHRALYEMPDIGGPDPGRLFDAHLSRVGRENIWVATVGDQVVGMAGLIPGDGDAELEPLVVRTPFRGRGVGKQLTQVVVERTREIGARQLRVRPTARNQTAMQFFHDLGFDILGQIELFMDFRPTSRQKWKAGGRSRKGSSGFRAELALYWPPQRHAPPPVEKWAR